MANNNRHLQVGVIEYDDVKLPCVTCYIQKKICDTCIYAIRREVARSNEKSSRKYSRVFDANTTYVTDADIQEIWPELKIDPEYRYTEDYRMVGAYMQMGELVPCARCYEFGFPCKQIMTCVCKNRHSQRNPCEHVNRSYHEYYGIASFKHVRPYSWFPETYKEFLNECKEQEHQDRFDALRYK